MNNVYITGLGKFLPGQPISNKEMEGYIGTISKRSSSLGHATLRQNGIKQRYYSCTKDGGFTHTNAQMAANATINALENARRPLTSLDLLATSTTQGDQLVPGFASAVHGELGNDGLELASFQSVCAGSLMAIKHASLAIRVGDSKIAAATGSEFSSRWFRPGFYEPFYNEESKPDPELEFLRWTLSDGAGSAVLEAEPNPEGLSLQIDWVKQKSFAHRFPACMYAGAVSNRGENQLPWNLYESPVAAYEAGAMALKQDFELLYKLFPAWIGYYLELVDEGLIDPTTINHFLPHYSAESLRDEMKKLLLKSAAMLPEERWFNNLATCGNTGAASIFIMLEELMYRQNLEKGQKILCFVPESGRSICAFMQLTVV